MNGLLESYDESFDESFDESLDEAAWLYDESLDETAEFLPGLGGIAGGIGNLLAPGIGNLIGGVIGGKTPPRRPLQPVRLPTPGAGVSTATLNTPAGTANIALPSALVRQDDFRALTERLQNSINQNASRLNTLAGDAQKLQRDFTAIEADTRKQVAKLKMDTRNALAKSRKREAMMLARLRKEQSSQQMMNLIMTIMMQQQMQDVVEDHTHTVTTTTGQLPVSTSKPLDTGSDNSMSMFLPLMMMQGDGASGDNNMMMFAMMMMANRD